MEHVYDARAMIQLADVQSINDTGQAQTATVMTSAGAVYSDIEVIQTYGVSSAAPVDGAIALVFAVGGDPANLRAFLFNPSFRYGRQQPGESAIFAPDGTRVVVREGGVVEVIGGNQIKLTAPTVTINASAAANITAPVINLAGEVRVAGGPLKVNGVIVIVP